ncbi:Polyphosphoinositide phosphatase [Tetrabaena socialis]|uniref:Polyphosphoinositide phosphatase n=1 Tax=Tetrabaena socialis TaxID=47790 RepID=A0A2J8AI58_9CHLO|nr:Polyphosphoinositide phosphatase [Tetrabaena socialis]|eukprot:PNH12209.1 Polyphosphoinositide phosphatase [Tetrabaena socialis]
MSAPSASISGVGNGGGKILLVHSPVKQRYYIVAKGSGRRQIHVLPIGQSGSLSCDGTKGRSVFDSEADAMDHLRKHGPVQTLASAPYILGYVVIGPWGLLLVAEKFRVSAVLPGNHEVKTVTKTQWLKIPLQIDASMQAPEVGTKDEKSMKDEIDKGIERLLSFPLDGAHFLCDTLDITRPFPSHRAVKDPSWDLVWNRWLAAPFRSLHLDFLCPPLLQGLCESRQLEDFDGAKYWIACISRRGCLHPGPRYKARGLNDFAEPGNELEVEQVIWRQQQRDGNTLLWSRYTWRRGSAPLWWGVSIKNNGIGEAEIKIRPHNTFRGAKRRLSRRGKAMSTEELHEQLKQIHLQSKQTDDEARAMRKAGSEAALLSMDPTMESANSIDLISFGGGGADSETSSVASGSGLFKPAPGAAPGAAAVHRSVSDSDFRLSGPGAAAATAGSSGTLSPAAFPSVGFTDWAQFGDTSGTTTPERAPRPGGPPVGLKPALKKAPLLPPPPPSLPPPGPAVDPLASLVTYDLI